MKKAISSLFVLFALLSCLLPARAAGPGGTLSAYFYSETGGRYDPPLETDRVSLTLNGSPLTPDGVPALIQYIGGDGRTLVPVRLVAEALDAQVLWVAATRQVIILKGEDNIVLTLGSAQATINGTLTDLPGGVPAGAVKCNGLESTMVPLRFVSEALGADVGWDNDTFTASIQTVAPPPTPTPTPTPTPVPSPSPTPSLPSEEDRGRVVSLESDDNAQSLFIATDHVPRIQVTDLGDRVAVDILGVTISPTYGTVSMENEVMTGVRYAQHDYGSLDYDYPHVVRFVIDLKEGATYAANLKVVQEVGGIRITSYHTEDPSDLPEIPADPIDPSKKTICIDPGHGGSASGAYYEGIMEKDLTLPMSLMLRDILVERGYNVVMTRDTDVYMDLYDRCVIANQVNADVFVSIHCNASATSSTFQGLFTYYHPSSNRSKKFAQYVQNAAAEATGAINRGILNNDYVVLRETDMAAVLVETGFMTCHDELMRLADPGYQQSMAEGIAEGVIQYLNSVSDNS